MEKKAQTLHALQASEIRYRRLFETAQDGILILNAETGEINDVNPYMIDMLHYSREEFLGMKLWEVSPFKDKVFNQIAFKELQDKGYVRYKDLPLETKEGKPVAVEFVSNVYKANGDKVIQCNIRNITERKQTQEALKESEKYFKAVTENSSDITIIIDKKGNIKYCSQSIKRYVGYTPDELIGRNVNKFIHPDDKKRALDDFNKAVLSKDSAIPNEFRIVHKDGSERYVDGLGKNLLDDPIIAGFIINVHDVTERKRADEALRKSEKQLSNAVNIAHLGPWEYDVGNDMFTFNDYFYDIFRTTAEQVGGYTMSSAEYAKRFVHPDDAALVGEQVRKCIETDDPNFSSQLEHRIIYRNGEIGYITVRIFIAKDENGRTVRTYGVNQDITERKQAEEKLKESENKYRLLADNVDDVIFVLDMNLNYTYVSPSVKVLRGYEPEEVMKQPSSKTLTPSSWDLVTKTIADDMKLGKTEHREINISRMLQLEMIRKDGTTVWTEVKISLIRNENQQPVSILGVTRDITERKRADEELKENEKKYRLLADNVDDVIFVLDMNLNYTYVSPSVKVLMGYEPEEFLKLQACEAMMPSSWDLATKNLSERIEKSEHGEINKFQMLQFEMRRKDGSAVWTEIKASFIRNENQRPVGIIGVGRDITERKKAEEELQQTLESLRKAVGATIQSMVSAIEMRDPYTAGHQLRVANLAKAIAKEMGLPQDKIEGIRMAGSIHDIGKLSIPAEILSKPTKLTNLEFSLIKEHALSGYDMLKNVESPWPLAQIVYQHHERMDGSGYPRNLKGDEILMDARIMAVADVVEAMASHRPYRPGLGIDAALAEIEKNKGTHYDNTVADACLRLFREKGYQLT